MEQLSAELIALGVVVIGGLVTLVKIMVDQLAAELRENTHITRQTKEAANGRLLDTLERLDTANNLAIELRAIIHERDDRMAYIQARHPEVDATLRSYSDRRASAKEKAIS